MVKYGKGNDWLLYFGVQLIEGRSIICNKGDGIILQSISFYSKREFLFIKNDYSSIYNSILLLANLPVVLP